MHGDKEPAELIAIRPDDQHPEVRWAVRLVALLNLSYFGIEFAVARSIESVSLFADSIERSAALAQP